MLQSDWTAKFLQWYKSGYSDVIQPPACFSAWRLGSAQVVNIANCCVVPLLRALVL